MNEMTDREVLEAAIPIIENQWCKGAWVGAGAAENGKVIHYMETAAARDLDRMEAAGQDIRYCAMGAVQRALNLKAVEATGNLTVDVYGRIIRVSQRLTKVIDEQHPGWFNDGWAAGEQATREYALGVGAIHAVEGFNDNHTREEMLAIFEKAAADAD